MGEGRFALLGGAAAIHKCYQPGLGALAAPRVSANQQSRRPACCDNIPAAAGALIESGSLGLKKQIPIFALGCRPSYGS
jgi:hypothetical protein